MATMQAVRHVDTRGMSREEWVAARRAGIGGSEIGAIAGVNPWETPLSVYLRKVGELPEKEQNQAMHWGNMLEAVVADEYKRRHPGYQVRRVNAILRHPEVPYFLGNVDREVRRVGIPPMLLEIKTSSAWMGGRWREDVPDHVMCQVQWYMGVAGYRTAIVAVLVGGNDYREIEIARDDQIIEHLQTIGHRFWQEHVLKRVPPAVEAADLDTLAQLFPRSNGQEIDLSALAGRALREYQEAREDLKAAEARVKAAEAQIKSLMGEAETAVVGGHRVSWKTITSQRLDGKALREALPDVYNQYLTTTSYRRFAVN